MYPIESSIIYQIYLRSFYDQSGDGIGDIPGITEKLSYIKSLGVDMIWINPFYPSPQKDNGYDVTDYKAIDPVFGTMADFERLIKEAKKRDIGIMIDLVFNHTSTAHRWFKKALSGDPYYRDFYYFKEGKENGKPPTNWQSKFGGSAWEKLPDSNEYYLHLYDVSQADLNWENPNVRKKLYDVVHFWMEKGVAGFRFDVLNVISKPLQFEDDLEGDGRKFYTDGPRVHQYIKELNQKTFGGKNLITVGEMSSTTIHNAIRYSNPNENEISMVFHFHHLKVDYKDGSKWQLDNVRFSELKDLFHTWQTKMSDGGGWDALFWNNHDQPRALGRFTSNDPRFHYQAATLLAATIHFMRGTPYIYMGEEIGMTNPFFATIDFYQDIETLNYYQILQKSGLCETEIMKIIQARSRDNSRIPMPWDNTRYGGFSSAQPLYPVFLDKDKINVKQAIQDKNSIFYFYKKLIALRKQYAVIQTGTYTPALTEEANLIAYMRENKAHQLLSIHYYGKEKKRITLPSRFIKSKVLLSNSNRKNVAESIMLHPYETLTLLVERHERPV